MFPRLFGIALLLALSARASAAEYIGAESCRACHPAAYDVWKASGHAKAASSLSPAQQADGRCVQCHARDVAQGGEPGVTCETCHGAGGYYWPQYVMRDAELARAAGLAMPDGKACAVCHDVSAPSLTPFDVEQKMKAIDHWTQSRAARKQAPPKKAERCPRVDGATASLANAKGSGFLARALRGEMLVASSGRVPRDRSR